MTLGDLLVFLSFYVTAHRVVVLLFWGGDLFKKA